MSKCYFKRPMIDNVVDIDHVSQKWAQLVVQQLGGYPSVPTGGNVNADSVHSGK